MNKQTDQHSVILIPGHRVFAMQYSVFRVSLSYLYNYLYDRQFALPFLNAIFYSLYIPARRRKSESISRLSQGLVMTVP